MRPRGKVIITVSVSPQGQPCHCVHWLRLKVSLIVPCPTKKNSHNPGGRVVVGSPLVLILHFLDLSITDSLSVFCVSNWNMCFLQPVCTGETEWDTERRTGVSSF